MSEWINKQTLLKQIDIDSDGEPDANDFKAEIYKVIQRMEAK